MITPKKNSFMFIVQLFSSLEKVIEYAKHINYPEAEFKQHKYKKIFGLMIQVKIM